MCELRNASGPEVDLFASLEGIANRTRPQIILDSGADIIWFSPHGLSWNVFTNNYYEYDVVKYRDGANLISKRTTTRAALALTHRLLSQFI